MNSKLVPTYLAEIPKDPTGENYLVGIHPTNNRISVWAVDAELKVVVINPIDGAIVSKANTTPFIIKVKTDNTGISGTTQFSLPIIGVGYNYDVNWGDGTTSSNVRGKITKTYAVAGTYEVQISGTFPRIYFNDTGDKAKITEINQWGTISWSSMERAFSGTNINITATDTPNLASVTSMKGIFRNATITGSNLTNWNTGSLVDMSEAFQGANITGSDISNWSVGNVTNMVSMFQDNSSFNQDLSNWCVSKIPTQPSNFDAGATAWSLSRPIWGTCPFVMTVKTNNAGSSASNQFTIPTTGTGYNYTVRWGDGSISTGVTGNITKTYSTAGTYKVAITGTFPRIFFNGTGDRLKLTEINSWGTNPWTSMANAFQGTAFAIKATDAPNLSAVTDMTSMFYGANLSGSNLSSWNVSGVTNMTSMFRIATNLPDLSSWDVSAVTNMTNMFYGANLSGSNLGNWRLKSNVVVTDMFRLATNLPDLSSWDVSAVTNMTNMFYVANLAGTNIGSWNVSAATNMTNMFNSASNIPNLSSWNVSAATNMTSMFNSASNIPNLSSWNVSNVTTMTNMFYGASTFNQNLSGWCVSSIPSKPTGFDTGATAWTLSRPIWGTCP